MRKMRKYSLKTLRKRLDKAIEQYDAEVMRGTGTQWGYCMRHNKTPSTTRLSRLQDRINELKEEIRNREFEED